MSNVFVGLIFSNKGQNNLAKETTSFFCHIRQVAARISKLVLGAWDPHMGNERS